MKLSAPSKLAFYISLVLFILALLAEFGVIAAINPHSAWLLIGSWAVLALGNVLTGF